MQLEDVPSKLLPQFFPSAWLKEIPEIVFSEFPSRIRIGYVLREEGGYSYLLQEHFESLRLRLEDLHSIAMRNLLQLPSAQITFADVPGGPEGFVRSDDNFAAVRLLLPELRATFSSKLGEEFLAIVPHRDDCFCWSRTQTAARQSRHAAQALEDFIKDDYNLTPDILLVDASGFRVYREQPDA